MEFILSILNITIYLFLALLHLYWVFGGQLGLTEAVPTNANGKRVFAPSRLGTFTVALGLMLFAGVNMGFNGMLKIPVDPVYIKYALWTISLIFLVRFIGDFRYIGIAKSFKGSVFACRDTYIYSPLCLLLAISNAIVTVL
ncbi:DUF3995 domain-containing protein [Taibaiella sp. KBW10]|uniref:DUF3995 domain-containing protein n=1 Tax=Taibaiella sp. KBW10 TaxID=2153357 RepID=UPI000F5A8FB4|nr:DUF3995 domain-containing protein [Taibaiella sp. KBW10]RQO29858.1 DUF3995 domain-containing protein [Taibaiella sp. KBW10]